MTTVDLAPLMQLGWRIAHRLALVSGVLYYEDELGDVAMSALARALGRYDEAKGKLRPFAAEWMVGEVRRAIEKEKKRARREVPAQDVDAAEPAHPAVEMDEMAGNALDALLSVYTGEDLRSNGLERLLTREAWACLHREIALLDAADRRLVELRYWEEMGWKEVAAELGMAERTAQTHDARIRAHLHERLYAWDRVRPLRSGT